MRQQDVRDPGIRRGQVRAYLGKKCDVEAVRLARGQFGGVVLQGTSGLRVARDLRLRGEDLRGVDVDPAVYLDAEWGSTSPDNLQLDLTSPGEQWVKEQTALGLDVVHTAGGRIRAGRRDALRSALQQSFHEDVVVLLALDTGWLGARHIETLEHELKDARRDVALVLAAPFDPVDTPFKVAALRQLIEWAGSEHLRLELLRTDLIGLPAALAGAAVSAVGLRTSTRHLGLPLGDRKAKADYEQRQHSPLVFVPRLLHWQRATVIAALSPWDGAGIADCDCSECRPMGSTLVRFGARTDPAVLTEKVDRHNSAAMCSLINTVMAAVDPVAELTSRRAEAVRLAHTVATDLHVTLDPPPKWISHWR